MNAHLGYFSGGVQIPAEIEEPSLRTPRPVSTTEWPTSCCCWRYAFAQKTFVGLKPPADMPRH